MILFCSDPLDRSTVDEPYRPEFSAAKDLRLQTAFINHEALVTDGDTERAIRKVAAQDPETSAVYRGWMIPTVRYQALHQALLSKGVRLVNDPAAYAYAHELPNWISDYSDVTPATVVIPLSGSPDFGLIHKALLPLGDSPLILKDYVKSQKHYWREACYIPSASDAGMVERITARFLELQGDSLAGGLVYRRFVDLDSAGVHPKSGMPLGLEYRLFFWDAKPLFFIPYWEGADYRRDPPPPELFVPLAARARSRFFTMDVAKTRAGDWIVIELGDGQVAGLPENADPKPLYRELASRLNLDRLKGVNHLCTICNAELGCGQESPTECSDCQRPYCPTCKAGYCGDHGDSGRPCRLCGDTLR